jgi:hypothetical protein
MEQAAAKSGSPPGRRARFMQWWLHSPFQAVWMRLAVQVGSECSGNSKGQPC